MVGLPSGAYPGTDYGSIARDPTRRMQDENWIIVEGRTCLILSNVLRIVQASLDGNVDSVSWRSRLA